MSAQPQLMLLFSLAGNPRGQLVDWYEDVQTQARSLCAPYDPAGTLSLVAVPRVWEDFPGNINNPAEVPAGTHPLTIGPVPRMSDMLTSPSMQPLLLLR
jgi:hypothetical protein